MRKRMLAGLLSGMLCLSMLTACSDGGSSKESKAESSVSSGESKADEASKTDGSKTEEASKTEDSKTDGGSGSEKSDSSVYRLFIRDGNKNEKLTAKFMNTQSLETKDVEMKKTSEGADYFGYTCEEDTSKYNVFALTYGDTTTQYAAFNKFVNGWYHNEGALLPCIDGKDLDYEAEYDTKEFEFDGYKKNVYIWKPKDYDAKSADKYSVIYMFDAQNVISSKIGKRYELWNSCQHVESMMSVTDNKAIIVAIDNNDDHRSDELIPDIGDAKGDDFTTKKRGSDFCEFIVNSIVPYVEQNYNVYTDRAHNAICGSSFGGLESFYVGMEHPEKFGTAGVFSASFGVFGEQDWTAYLGKKKFGDESAFLYIYSGAYAADAGVVSQLMNNGLVQMGYPKDKIVNSRNENAEHNEIYWRNIYPEFLEAMFTGKVSGLESGALVSYVDTLDHSDGNKPIDDPDGYEPVTGEKAKYVYFDNSETKWDRVCTYWWDGEPVNKATGEAYEYLDWPGREMERIEGTDIWRIGAPDGISAIIFSSGITDEEVKNGVTAYQTANIAYNTTKCAGRVYKIDMSVKPKKGPGWQKTKFGYSVGEWLDYNE